MLLFFSGISGSGMSAIAQILVARGYRIRGSDREFDRGRSSTVRQALLKQGIDLYSQDGSGVSSDIDEIIVSSAVEDTTPDVQRANELGIPIVKRAELLARIFNEAPGIAVAGTSGKTTVTGMVGYILEQCGRHPTIINGGIMLNYRDASRLGNAVCGDPRDMVIEADESDGTVVNYQPRLGVITNISCDHKSLPDLRDLFATFIDHCGEYVIVNRDCSESTALMESLAHGVTFGIENPDADFNAQQLQLEAGGSRFVVNGVDAVINIPGRHNVANAVAAIAACESAGVEILDAIEALATFTGIKRRIQVVGREHNITVIDDFAHNPEKIEATLAALQPHSKRVLAMFQPHGFAPARMMKSALVEMLSRRLRDDDILAMPDIYYAGGAADRDVSSNDIVQPLAKLGRQVQYVPKRAEIAQWFMNIAEPGDTIVVMGARDHTLSDFAYNLLASIQKRGVGVPES